MIDDIFNKYEIGQTFKVFDNNNKKLYNFHPSINSNFLLVSEIKNILLQIKMKNFKFVPLSKNTALSDLEYLRNHPTFRKADWYFIKFKFVEHSLYSAKNIALNWLVTDADHHLLFKIGRHDSIIKQQKFPKYWEMNGSSAKSHEKEKIKGFKHRFLVKTTYIADKFFIIDEYTNGSRFVSDNSRKYREYQNFYAKLPCKYNWNIRVTGVKFHLIHETLQGYGNVAHFYGRGSRGGVFANNLLFESDSDVQDFRHKHPEHIA